MGRKRSWIARWQKAFNRRDFLIATYTTVLGWGLARYFPPPAPVAQLPPITGTLNVTLEPVVGVVRWNAFVAVDSVSIKLGESQSVERVTA